MSAPIPVMKRHIKMLSGSAKNPMLTLKLPDGIHVNKVCVRDRSSSGNAKRSKKTFTTTRKLAATIPVPHQPAPGSPSFLPATNRTKNPNRGRQGMSQIRFIRSTPQQRNVIGVSTLSATHDCHNDPEPNHYFGCSHHHHKKDDCLTSNVV